MINVKCYNGGKKHKFKPRYDENPSGFNYNHIRFDGITDELRNLLVIQVYIKDICVWCGKEIKK